MNIILFDQYDHDNLLPFTFTRPVSRLRVGILTIIEKWEYYYQTKISELTNGYLQVKFPLKVEEDNLMINASILPNTKLTEEIRHLQHGRMLVKNGIPVAALVKKADIEHFDREHITRYKVKEASTDFSYIAFPWDIFRLNGQEIANDFHRITKGRKSKPLTNTVNVFEPERIFLEEGAKVEFSTLNPKGGYIYIGKDTEIMEGSIVRGSLALCEHSTLKIGAKIYGPTTIGPYSKTGGEVNNSVIQGNSNKGHDGFLGNSVIGEWCNLGADTNNSNLKNNYAEVKVWNYKKKGFINTGLQFCGLFMGDHSKCGINTMFNTGTVVGVSANIFGAGFPRNFIPSFTWGGAAGLTTYTLTKAFETAKLVMERRNNPFNEIEQNILTEVFKLTEEFRTK
jgi:UDP-N-acetylglucosamine diphosphorylase/glucosamine-1-phosphate N-acetyltransferase